MTIKYKSKIKIDDLIYLLFYKCPSEMCIL